MAIEKAKLWMGVCYPENMIPDWEESIGDILQLPYAYAIHDRDKNKDGSPAGVHVHLMVGWSNTTTKKHAINVMRELSADGKNCISTVKAVIGAKQAFDYLIHDTEDCRKKGKYLYDKKVRKTGNNFDIHFFEQLSLENKRDIALDLCNMIVVKKITNFVDFYELALYEHGGDVDYFDVIKTYSGLFERMVKGVYLKYANGQR